MEILNPSERFTARINISKPSWKNFEIQFLSQRQQTPSPYFCLVIADSENRI
jgi:hypothetical protein